MMMKYFLLISYIIGINLYGVSTKVNAYPYLISYFGYYNKVKRVLYMEMSVTDQENISSRRVMIKKNIS